MTTHVKQYCEMPENSRKNRLFEGMLWACDCGKIYRWGAGLGTTENGNPILNWREYKL